MEYKQFLFALVFLTLISSVGAVTLDSGTILNATGSNSTISFNTVTVTVDQATVTTLGVYLYNASYTNGDLTVVSNTTFNWSTENTNIDSSTFPALESASSGSTKIISSSLVHNINATITFPIDDCDINVIRYTSSSGATTGTYSSPSWVCDNTAKTLSMTLREIESGSANTLSIDYDNAVDNAADEIAEAILILLGFIGIIVVVLAAGLLVVFVKDGFDMPEGFIHSKLSEIPNWIMIFVVVAVLSGIGVFLILKVAEL